MKEVLKRVCSVMRSCRILLRYLPAERIIDGSKEDNFWGMGDTGRVDLVPEIHIDIRSQEEREKVNGLSLVNKNHPQVIEIWNLVFMQYTRKADGCSKSCRQK